MPDRPTPPPNPRPDPDPPGEGPPPDLVEGFPDALVVVGPDGRLQWGNDIAEELFGWSLAELSGRDVTELVHPDDMATALASLGSVQDKPTGTLVEIRVRDRGEGYRRVEVRGRTLAPGTDRARVVLALRDLTDRRRWELLAGEDAAATAVMEVMPTIALLLDPDGTVRGANRAFTTLLGHPLEGSLGRPFSDFVTVSKVLAVADQVAESVGSGSRRSFEAELVTSTGEARPMNITLVDLSDDRAVRGLVLTATDISDLAAARDRLAHAATHDSLTGLPNRLLLQERLELALSNASLRGVGVAVVFVDIDDFRAVNDRFGHRSGDLALVEVASRLGAAVRDTDMVARYGGDEFVLVASGMDNRSIGRLVDRVAWLMRTPVALAAGGAGPPVEVRLTVSTGAVLVEPGTDAAEALERADAALQRDRTRGREHG